MQVLGSDVYTLCVCILANSVDVFVDIIYILQVFFVRLKTNYCVLDFVAPLKLLYCIVLNDIDERFCKLHAYLFSEFIAMFFNKQIDRQIDEREIIGAVYT